MSFVVFAWIASISFGLVGVIAKFTSKHQISNPWLFNFVWSFFILLISLPVAIVHNVSIPSSWGPVVLAGFFYATSGIGVAFALQRLDISVISPLFNLRIVTTALFSAIILKEFYAQEDYMLMVLVNASGLFITMDEKFSFHSFFKSGTIIMIATTILMSFKSISIGVAGSMDDVWTVSFWMFLIGQGILLITIPFFKKEITKLKTPHLANMFLMSLFGTVGFLAENSAYAENITITTIITTLPISMVIAFVLSFIAPQLLEKHTLKVYAVRFAAAAVMIGATLKLTL